MVSQNDPALASLIGLSVGDAFGAQILLPGDHPTIQQRVLPAAPWRWTDDTEMACSVFATLTAHDEVRQDWLAASFAEHFDPDRGYGSGVERMLHAFRRGESWFEVSRTAFGGQGSWGNGAAMRVAPVGAWFRNDLDQALEQAGRSALVTHSHPEAVIGACAVAAAAALVAANPSITGMELLTAVAGRLADSQVANGVRAAIGLLADRATPNEAAAILGTGREVAAHDTVPLALWIAAGYLDSFEDAMWAVALVAEDVDTVCAIVGGIISARLGVAGIPLTWRDAREPLPEWAGVGVAR